MTTPKHERGFVWSVVTGWDLYVSLAATAIFVIIVVMSDRPFIGNTTALGIAIPFGVAIMAASGVIGRWVSDLLKKEEYGILVRMTDPDESSMHQPFHAVTAAGGLVTAFGIIGLALQTEVSAGWNLAIYSALWFFAWYSILGVFTLVLQQNRLARNAASMRSLHEQTDFWEREQRRKG